MKPEDWWAVAWFASGIPFAVVSTAVCRRELGFTWPAALTVSIATGSMFGPISLLLICCVSNEETS